MQFHYWHHTNVHLSTVINCLIYDCIIIIMHNQSCTLSLCPVREDGDRYTIESPSLQMEKNALLNFCDVISMTSKFMVKVHRKTFNPEMWNSAFISLFLLIFCKTKNPDNFKAWCPFLPLLSAGFCGEEIYPACTCGIGVWEKKTLEVYLIRIRQPSSFLCSCFLLLCHFCLHFPYQLISAMPFVLWHNIEKMESVELMSLPLINDYTLIWNGKHVFYLFTDVTTRLFNSDSWCLGSNSHEGW